MVQLFTTTYISDPVKGQIYILELVRRGCRKLRASCMPEIGKVGDCLIPLREVPLSIRRAALRHLCGADPTGKTIP
jgi:hypothetical protein